MEKVVYLVEYLVKQLVKDNKLDINDITEETYYKYQYQA